MAKAEKNKLLNDNPLRQVGLSATSVFSRMPPLPASSELIEYLMFRCPRRPENKDEQYRYWIEPIIREATSGLRRTTHINNGKALFVPDRDDARRTQTIAAVSVQQSDRSGSETLTKLQDSTGDKGLTVAGRFASWLLRSPPNSELTKSSAAQPMLAPLVPPSHARLTLVIPDFEPIEGEDNLIDCYEQNFQAAGKKLIKQLVETQTKFNLMAKPVYGAVTSGYEWEFYCLHGRKVDRHRVEDVLIHYNTHLATLLGILRFIAAEE